MRQLGIGFLGAGMVANLHAEAVARCAGARLVGLWNRTPARAREKARAFGCASYGSAAELLADPAVDAVHVLTNLETHHALTLQALAAGKHVLVEKPVGARPWPRSTNWRPPRRAPDWCACRGTTTSTKMACNAPGS